MAAAFGTAIITGASSGLGRALALALAAEDCQVGLIARRRELLEQTAGAIASLGGRAHTAVADISSRDETLTAVARLRESLGPIDLLVANAGVGAPTELEPPNVVEQERILRTNLFGVLYAFEAVLPEMLRRRKGHLAAVSSLAAYKGLPGQAAYCASKAAVNAYLEGLRIQLHGRGVAVTTICPGFVRTPMVAEHPFRMPLVMEPELAARRVVRALKQRRKVYNFPWRIYLLMRLTRWLPDWLLARGFRPYRLDRLEGPP